MTSSGNKIGYSLAGAAALVIIVALFSNNTTARIMYWIETAIILTGIIWVLYKGIRSKDEKNRRISLGISLACAATIIIYLAVNITRIPYYFGKTYIINDRNDLYYAEEKGIPVIRAKIIDARETGDYLTEEILFAGSKPSENGGRTLYKWVCGDIGGDRRLIRVAPENYIHEDKLVTLCLKKPDSYDTDVAKSISLSGANIKKIYYCDNKALGEDKYIAGFYVIGLVALIGFVYCVVIGIKNIKEDQKENSKDDPSVKNKRSKDKKSNNYSPNKSTDGLENFYKNKWDLLSKSIGYPLDKIVFTKEEVAGAAKWERDINELYKITYHIFKHLKVASLFGLRIKYDNQIKEAGTYSRENGMPIITINLMKHFTYKQVFAVLCHECVHHYLRLHDVELKVTSENELLTDVACVYLGMGDYLAQGYKPIYEYQGDQKITHTLGYVSPERIAKLAMWWERDKAIEKFEKEEAELKENLKLKLQNNIVIYKDIISRSTYVYDSLKTYKGVIEQNDMVVLQEFARDMEYVSYEELVSKCEMCLNDGNVDEEAYNKLLCELDEKCTVLTYRCCTLSKYL